MTNNSSEIAKITINNLKENNVLLENEDQDDPVGKLLNKIILKGLQKEASEICFEPESDCLKIIFCQYGLSLELIKPLNKAISQALINKLKIIANIKHHNQPVLQGSFYRDIQDNKYHFWLDIIPTPHGKKAILRWWNNNQNKLNLDDLVSDENTLNSIKAIANSTQGLLLVIGLNNSGKSTTLYSLIDTDKTAGLNIATIDNRLKYSRPNINHIPINRVSNLDCDKYIANLANKQIEVLLIEHLKENHKANIAITAAKKGHLVLSSLNANNSYDAIVKLLETGIKSSHIAKTLNGVINQRLLRQLCPYCRIEYKPSAVDLNRFGLLEKDKINVYHANNTIENNCSYCQGIGYKGQIAVYEVLKINNELRNIIAENSSLEIIKQSINQQEFPNLLDYAINLVMSGETTFAEIERVLPDMLNNLALQQKDNRQKLLNSEEKITSNLTNIKPETINNLEDKMMDNYQDKMMELEVKLSQKYEQEMLSLEKRITQGYLKNLKKLEQTIESLQVKYTELEKKITTYLPMETPLKLHEKLEELTDDEDWDNLTKELEATFPTTSSQKKKNIDELKPIPVTNSSAPKSPPITDNNCFKSDNITDPW